MVKPELAHSSHKAKDLVGTWALVSVVAERDGRQFDSYGPNAKGFIGIRCERALFDDLNCSDIPHFASGGRSSGTADENKAVVAGSIAHFGTYVVDEADKSFTLQIDRATFPNWEGKHSKRSFVIIGDELAFKEAARVVRWGSNDHVQARNVILDLAAAASDPFATALREAGPGRRNRSDTATVDPMGSFLASWRGSSCSLTSECESNNFGQPWT